MTMNYAVGKSLGGVKMLYAGRQRIFGVFNRMRFSPLVSAAVRYLKYEDAISALRMVGDGDLDIVEIEKKHTFYVLVEYSKWHGERYFTGGMKRKDGKLTFSKNILRAEFYKSERMTRSGVIALREFCKGRRLIVREVVLDVYNDIDEEKFFLRLKNKRTSAVRYLKNTYNLKSGEEDTIPVCLKMKDGGMFSFHEVNDIYEDIHAKHPEWNVAPMMMVEGKAVECGGKEFEISVKLKSGNEKRSKKEH